MTTTSATFPSTADIQHWLQTVQPCCVRDDSLWGFAYAALNQALPSSLGDFQAFQHNVYTAASSVGWDADFILGYIQQSGQWPTPDTLGAYLTKINAGNPPGQQNYPKGGTGYPPPASSGGTGGTGTGGTVSFDSVVKWVEANPIPTGLGAVALVLLLRR